MRKYVIRNRKPRLASYEDGPDGEDYLARTVYEPAEPIVPPGLLDSHGNDICRDFSIGPIGFVTDLDE